MFRKLNQGLSGILQAILVAIFIVLVVDVTWGVISRHFFDSQAAWSEELARLLMVWLALLGAALVCREQGHLGLDIVVRSWPNEVQRLGRLFVHLAVMFFGCVIMGWGGWQLMSDRFASGQTLPALGIAKAWFYLALPVSGSLITLFAAELFWADLREQKTDEAKGEQ